MSQPAEHPGEEVLAPTVETALLIMAGRCDGAVVQDSAGYNAFDTMLGHRLAERLSAGHPLTGKQRRAAYRMLQKYAVQLRSAGLDLAAVPYPDDAPTSPEASARLRAARRDDIKLTVAGGRIIARTPFDLKEVCRSIPGARWNPRVQPEGARRPGAWTYPESPRSALNVREAFAGRGELVCDDAFMTLIVQGEGQAAARAHKSAEDLPAIPNEVMASWNHQRQAFWFAREQDAALLWMEMGTGKSKVAVDLLRENQARRSIILCPAKVLGVWPKQFRIHGPEQLFHVVNGMVRLRTGRFTTEGVEARTQMFDTAVNDCRCGRFHVVVANYEITAYDPFKTWALEQEWDYAVADESHRLRAAQGVWSKWASKLRDRAGRRLALTGTALGQSELDIFAQYRFLDPSIFGTSYTSFEHRYAVKGGYGGYEVVAMRTKPMKPDGSPNPYYSAGIAQEFDEKLFSVAYEVGAEVLDLPPDRDITRTCELPAAARRAYRGLDDDLFADLQAFDAGEVTTPNVLVKMLRLQQLTGGALHDDEGNLVEVHTAKQELLEDVLSDLDVRNEPVVVFARFTHDLDVIKRVADKLKVGYAELSGRREDALTEDSTLAPDNGVIAVQIQSGGVGIDFTKSHVAIYYSTGFSRIDFVQSRKRLHRPGQERPVLFVHLVAEGTIDQDVYEALERNEEAVQWVAKRLLQARGQ